MLLLAIGRQFQETSTQIFHGTYNGTAQIDLGMLGKLIVSRTIVSNQLTKTFVTGMMIGASATAQKTVESNTKERT